jgi:ribosomal protein L7/L12
METHGNGPITLNFTDGQCVQVNREFWTKNDLGRFDIVRAEKINNYGIVFYGEYLSEEEKALRPKTEVVEAQTEFTVILKSFGAKKLEVVREVKDITALGLRESMALVTELGTLKENVSKEEAEMIKERLTEAGAEVEIK